MAKAKVTGSKAARNASKTLRNKNTSAKSKTASGSALSQTNEVDPKYGTIFFEI